MWNDPTMIAAVSITIFCGIAALALVGVGIYFPGQAPHLIESVQRMMLFLFSVGAGAIIFKALG